METNYEEIDVMQITVYNHIKIRDKEVRYSVEALLDRIGYEANWRDSFEENQSSNFDEYKILLTYGLPDGKNISQGWHVVSIPSCGFFEMMYGNPSQLLKRDNIGLPFLKRNNWKMVSNKWILLGGDIVASAFFCLSRYEEVYDSAEVLDSYGGLSAKGSIMGSMGILDRPIVDEYADDLGRAIGELLGKNGAPLSRPSWNGHSFAVVITHDVDQLAKYSSYTKPFRTLASLSLRYGEYKATFQTANEFMRIRWCKSPDPYEYKIFKNIHEVHDRLGFRSAYYFLVGGDHPHDINHVDMDSKISRRVLDFLENEGYEIGFHPSFEAFLDEEQFCEQLKLLRSLCRTDVIGGRQHFLKFAVPSTWRLWEKNGLLYDSTLGFADCPGFRCGTCFPFKPFDLRNKCVLDLWELPLTVMDQTLRDRLLGNMKVDDAFAFVCSLMERVKSVNGIFVLLWHPSYFDDVSYPSWSRMYVNLLEYAKELGAYIGPPREILKEWEKYRKARIHPLK